MKSSPAFAATGADFHLAWRLWTFIGIIIKTYPKKICRDHMYPIGDVGSVLVLAVHDL